MEAPEVEALQKKVDAIHDRVAEWEKFFHETGVVRHLPMERAEADRADAEADVLLLKTALLKLIEAAKDVPPTAALGSMIVSGEFALMRVDRTIDVKTLAVAALKAVDVLEGKAPPSLDVVINLKEALHFPKIG